MTSPLNKPQTNSTNSTVEEAAAAEVKKFVGKIDGTNLLGKETRFCDTVTLLCKGIFPGVYSSLNS